MEMEASNLIMAERSPVASPGGISSKLGGKTLNNAISISVTVADTKVRSA